MRAGIAVYNALLKRARLRPLLLWGSLVGVALGLTPLMLVEGVNRRLGISDRAFALVDSALLSSIGQVRHGGWQRRQPQQPRQRSCCLLLWQGAGGRVCCCCARQAAAHVLCLPRSML